MIQKNGATVTINNGPLTLGYNATGDNGSYTISDPGSTLALTDPTGGWLYVGHTGTGTFTQNGGTVNLEGNSSSNGLVVGGVNSTYNMNGGTLRAPKIWKTTSTAAFDFAGGTIAPYGSAGLTIGSSTSANNIDLTLTGGSGTISSLDAGSVARTVDVYSTITGGYGLNFAGAGGTINLRAANTYSGTTTISGGTLTLVNSGAAKQHAGLRQLRRRDQLRQSHRRHLWRIDRSTIVGVAQRLHPQPGQQQWHYHLFRQLKRQHRRADENWRRYTDPRRHQQHRQRVGRDHQQSPVRRVGHYRNDDDDQQFLIFTVERGGEFGSGNPAHQRWNANRRWRRLRQRLLHDRGRYSSNVRRRRRDIGAVIQENNATVTLSKGLGLAYNASTDVRLVYHLQWYPCHYRYRFARRPHHRKIGHRYVYAERRYGQHLHHDRQRSGCRRWGHGRQRHVQYERRRIADVQYH